ncbi:MAG: HAD hydrolase-like protein [Muribaculaceae bacterium]|mgnify:FL=1|nr:HAD hydrolase-like protein [Muribaculaceae bacterium]
MNLKDIITSFKTSRGYTRIIPRAALFDMDGTLYDSMPGHAYAWMKMCDEAGLQATPDDFFMAEGRTGADTIEMLFRRNYGRSATADDVERLYAIKSANFRALPPVQLMPGAQEAVGACMNAGLTTVLVTGSGQSSLIERLATDYPGAFSLKVSSRDVRHGKPRPEPYIRAMQMAAVEPWEAIVVENAPLGVQSGVAAGVFTIGVATGLPPQVLAEAGADVVFTSMPECAAAMPQLLEALRNA